MRKLLLVAMAAASMTTLAATPSFACACCGSWKVVGVSEYDTLRVRSGPGVGNRVVDELPPGVSCVIKSNRCRGNWCRITWGNVRGWVNTRYLARHW